MSANDPINIMMQEYSKKPELCQEDLAALDAPKAIQSDRLEDYYRIMAAPGVAKDNIPALFLQHGIQFTPLSAFELFSFEVEEILPAAKQYKIYVKIAHFGLTITAIRQESPDIFVESDESVKGTYGRAYFAQIVGRQACFKSFLFGSVDEFHDLFKKVIKEWSILKICSILQCGPAMIQCLGFDLIICDNSIQYVTEKGITNIQINPYQAINLKQELALMHRFRIIHYDIKPGNIVFSKVYGKTVFIDFGFSEIIEDKIGVKTFGGFRGTPNYCSQEMLSLMVSQKGYVDLYYNDAYSLSLTLDQMKAISEKEQIGKNLLPQHGLGRQQVLFFLAFKAHYLKNDQIEYIGMLHRYLRCGGNIKNILSFIKKLVQFIFLSSILYQCSFHLKDSILYQQILSEYKFSSQKIFFRRNIEIQEAENSDILMIRPFSANDLSWTFSDNNQDYVHLFTIIMKASYFQQKTVWNYLAIAFSCVKFTTRNLSIDEKYQVSKQMNSHVFASKSETAALQANEREPLLEIKLFLVSLLNYCISQKVNKWSKESIFDIFHQLILLDVDILPYLNQFIKFLDKNVTSASQIALVTIECGKANDLFQLVTSDHTENIDNAYALFNALIDRKLKIFQQPHCEHYDEEMNSISKNFYYLKRNEEIGKQPFLENVENNLKNIKDLKVRKYFSYLMTYKMICYYFDNSLTQKLIKTAIHMKRCWQSGKLDLISWIKITMRLLKSTYSYLDVPVFIKQISKLINCDEVFKRINFQNIPMKESFSSNQFLRTINKFSIEYSKMQAMSQFGDFRLFQIINQLIFRKIVINSSLRELLIKLYRSYQRYNEKNKKGNPQQVKYFYQMLCRAQIDYFFYQLCPQTQGVFEQNYRDYDKEQKSKQTQGQLSFHLFKRHLYGFKYFSSKRQYHQCVNALSQLAHICYQQKINFLTLEVLRALNLICSQLDNSTLFIFYSSKLMEYCKEINHIRFYLSSSNTNITFYTLAMLARQDSKKFNEFLINLTDLLNSQAVDSYFAAFLLIIDKFLRKDSNHGYLIHYSNFEKNPPCYLKNPYFLIFYAYSLHNELEETRYCLFRIIANNINRLTQFAKRKILERYFVVYLKYINDKQLRFRLFIFRQAKIFLPKKIIKKQGEKLLEDIKRSWRLVRVYSDLLKKKARRALTNYAINRKE